MYGTSHPADKSVSPISRGSRSSGSAMVWSGTAGDSAVTVSVAAESLAIGFSDATGEPYFPIGLNFTHSINILSLLVYIWNCRRPDVFLRPAPRLHRSLHGEQQQQQQ